MKGEEQGEEEEEGEGESPCPTCLSLGSFDLSLIVNPNRRAGCAAV